MIDDDFTAFLEPFVSEGKRELFDSNLGDRTRWITVVLEDVYQQYNASACLRSCDGFGVQDVHVVEDRNTFEPDGQIALGAAQWLTMHRHDSTAECIDALHRDGYRVVATSPHGRSRSLAELAVDRPTALVFGTEMRGLSEEALELADETLHIPMRGFSESFNVSVCVAVCLWQLTQRMRATGVDWRLSAAERAALRGAWIRSAIGENLPAYERRWRESREDSD